MKTAPDYAAIEKELRELHERKDSLSELDEYYFGSDLQTKIEIAYLKNKDAILSALAIASQPRITVETLDEVSKDLYGGAGIYDQTSTVLERLRAILTEAP